jgi:alpha-beta hydrolase superfamily lysophospholipase
MNSQEGSYQGSDGRSLFYRFRLPGKAAGTVLLLHGYAEHSGRHAWLMERLEEAGFAVYAPDLRGHGRSARPGVLADLDSLEAAIRDIAALLPVIRQALPERPLFLLGFSMGGMLALLFTLRHPEGLAGLVASGAAVEIPEYVSPFLLKVAGLLGRLLPRLPSQPFDFRQASRDPEVIRDMEADPLYYKGKLRIGTGYQQLLGIREVMAKLSHIRLPLLLLHGGEDRIISPKASKMIYDAVSSPDKTQKIFPGLYHEVLNEPEKGEVLAVLLDWLRRHLD